MKMYLVYIGSVLGSLCAMSVWGDEYQELSHPPTFAQIQAAKSLLGHDDYTDEDWAYTMQIEDALQYTADDLDLLCHDGDLDDLLGAAYTSSYEEASRLLHQEWGRIQQDPRALSLYLTTTLLQDASMYPENLDTMLQHFVHLDQDNSVPSYLMAYYFAVRGDPSQSLEWLTQGNAQGTFTDYIRELWHASIQASEHLGYSPFAARHHALSQYDWFLYAKLTKFLLTFVDDVPGVGEQVTRLGERLQAFRSTHMLELTGLSFQEKALEFLDIEESMKHERRQRIQANRQAIHDLLDQFYAVGEQQDISEHRWVQYFDEVYTTSERMAMEG